VEESAQLETVVLLVYVYPLFLQEIVHFFKQIVQTRENHSNAAIF